MSSPRYTRIKRFGEGLAACALQGESPRRMSSHSPRSRSHSRQRSRSHSQSKSGDPQGLLVRVEQHAEREAADHHHRENAETLVIDCMKKHFDVIRSKSEVEHLKKQLEEQVELAKSLQGREDENALLRDELSALKARNADLELVSYNFQQLHADNIQLRSTVGSLEERVSKYEGLSSVKDEVECLKTENKSLLAELEERDSVDCLVAAKLDASIRAVDAGERQIRELRDQVTALKSELLRYEDGRYSMIRSSHGNMLEMEALRKENMLLKEVNASLESELRLARESQSASFQQIRSLITLTEKYAVQLRSQTEENKMALEGLPFDGEREREKGRAPNTPNRNDTSFVSQPGTPVEMQQLVHDSPPAPIRGSDYIPQMQSPIIQRAIKPFAVKKQRQALLAGDAWAPKGSALDSDLVVGVSIPSLPSQAKMEPMLLGGRIYKIQLELENGDTQLSFFNGTRDMQFMLDYHFLEGSRLSPGDSDVAISEDFLSFSLTIYPGMLKTLVRGIVNGYSMNMRYGYASTSCLDYFREDLDSKLAAASDKVRLLCQSSNSPDDSSSVADLCALSSTPFVDPEFPPCQQSISRVFEEPTTVRPWIRMEEALAGKNMTTGLAPMGIEPNDIDAGLLCDSWLLSTFSVLAEDPRNVMSIFESAYLSASRTTITQDHRAGIYRLRLCKGGWWETFVIDDWLPASPLGPAFARSVSCAGALWPSLLQKAFAKMYGSYSSLRGGGDALSAFTDFTGCGYDYFNWRSPSDAWTELEDAVSKGYLVIVTTPGVDPTSEVDEEASSLSATYKQVGLVTGYSYLVLKASDGQCTLRNVWGDPAMWKGAKDEGAGVITVNWSEMSQMFDSGGVCYSKPGQIALRVQVQFTPHQGPNVMVALQVMRECTVIVTIHQKDRRGLHEDVDESVAYCTSVIGDHDGHWTLIDSSHQGTFWKGRETVLRIRLKPSAKPYYFVPRAYKEDVEAGVTFSFVLEGKCEGNIARFLQPTAAVMESLYFSPIYNFDPAACQPIRPLVQTGRDAPMASQSVTITDAIKLPHY